MEPDATDNSKDDDELLLRILNGDETAWEQLVASYKTAIYRTAYRVTCNEDDAFDATQETFMKIARNLPALRNRSTFHSWATSIAVREALNIHRKRARFPHAVDPETIATVLDNQQAAHAHQAHQATHVIRQQQVEQLNRAAQELSPQQRAIITLGLNNNLAPHEVAEELQLPASQVRSQWARAITKLKMILNPTSPQEGDDHDSPKN